MLDRLQQLVENLPIDLEFWLWMIGAVSVGSILFTFTAIPLVLCSLPEDYFVRETRIPPELVVKRTFPALLLFGLKNVFGGLLIIIGFLLLFTPGQGGLTMFAGIILMNFPGKYALERKFMKQKPIYMTANWIRKKMGMPAFLSNE